MKIRIYAVALGIAIGAVTGSSLADVNDKMAEMFGAQSNFTRPGSAEGATRGVLTGGNVMVRTPIVTASGFSFDRPDISAGCGGIDMYGGNLSFPSKEQYIATARAVVGNVGGYAFKSALKIVCEACESTMSAIQDTVNMLNIDNMNSCQIAQGVVDGVKDGSLTDSIAKRGRDMAAKWETAAGDVSDWFEAQRSGPGKESPAKGASSNPEMAGVLSGNWTWSSMQKTQVFDWLGTDRGTREEVMSLLGTVVTCVPGVNGCEGNGTDPVPTIYTPYLRLQDFVAPEKDASELYWVWTCNDDECLNVTQKQRKLGATVTQKIIDTLLGKDGQPGVLQRMALGGSEAGKISDQEKALIENVPDMMSQAVACMNAGETGAGYARTLVEGMAPMIAADALFRAADQSIPVLLNDLNLRQDAVGAGTGVRMLEQARTELRIQHEQIKNVSTRSDMLLMAVQRCGKSPIAAASYGINAR